MKNKKVLAIFLSLAIFLTGCQIKGKEEDKPIQTSKFQTVTMEEASTAPYGKYPELITYTLGKLTQDNNSNMPPGDTYENNAYTRYLKDMLNIQNKDLFEATGNLYDSKVSMAITDRELPDIMIVSDLNTLKQLAKEDLIEDLTNVYKTCASDKIKSIYNSYGSSLFDLVTVDNKLMALPGTNILNGPNLLWLRKDWMEKLSLDPPTTLAEAEGIIQAFVEADPGNNGEGQTIGLVADIGNLGESDKNYSLDVIFYSYGAVIKKWMTNKEGNVYYGSVTPEAKQAIAHIRNLYQKKILDPQFMIRTSGNMDDLIINGTCGSFFGPWWAANSPLMKAYEQNNQADWQPYLIPTNKDGSSTTCMQSLSDKFIVVRKGYEHPEIAIKILNVLFDYTRYVDMDNEEIQSYYSHNIDPTARPLAVNIDYQDALFWTTKRVKKALNGELKREELITIEKSYYDICRTYLQNTGKPKAQEWAAYMSRIISVDQLAEANINYIEVIQDDETKTKQKEGWNLDLLEKNAYIKMICGEDTLSYFQQFQQEWYDLGGKLIQEELKEWEDEKN